MFLKISKNKLKLQVCNFIKKETLAQVFSCEFCEISNNAFSTEHLRTTTSQISREICIFLKSSLLFRQFVLSFLFINKTLPLNNLKIKKAMNAKILRVLICAEVILHLLLYNLHERTFKHCFIHDKPFGICLEGIA